MRTRFSFICLLVFALPAFAAIVDRTAVTVGTKVITESEILRRIRLAAFQNGLQPDFSEASRQATAQRLIDLKLVEREMDLGHYARTTPERAKALVDAFTAEHFRSSAEALRLALAVIHLTPMDLQDEFAEQEDLLSFTALRFRPAVEIADQQIEEYFHSRVESRTAANPVALADVRASIEQILIGERADQDLYAWLLDQRTRGRIVYLEKELQ